MGELRPTHRQPGSRGHMHLIPALLGHIPHEGVPWFLAMLRMNTLLWATHSLTLDDLSKLISSASFLPTMLQPHWPFPVTSQVFFLISES